MEDQKKPKKGKKSLLKKLLRIFGWIVFSIIGLLLLAAILIQLPPVQNFAKKKVVSYLESKIHTKVAIEKINLQFPTSLSLRMVYFEDQAKDTLLYGNKIKVDISMWQLIRNEINIRGVYLDGIVANLERKASDSTFNFQYIIDAFTSEQKKEPEKEDSSTMQFSVSEIQIDNSHFVYNDLYTGNDLNVKLDHFKTTIKTFDLDKLSFDINLIETKGLTGYFHQLVPGKEAVEEVVSQKGEESGTAIQISNKTFHLEDINFQFNSDVSHMKSSYVIGDAELHPKKIDMENMVIALDDASLRKADIVIEMAPEQDENKPAKNTETDTATSGLKITADKLEIENSNFKMDNKSAPVAASGMDFNHLSLTDINLDARNILYSSDTMQANLRSASLKDRSGFELDKMEVKFAMDPTGITLDGLYIKTPNSEIKRSAAINYPSLASLSENPGAMGVNVDLANSRIAVRDLLFFMPQMESQLASLKNESLFVDATLKGRVSDLQIQKLVLNGLSGTDINVRGKVAGLPDAKKINADLNIIKFSTNKKDIQALMPPSALPSDVRLPSHLSLSGVVRGGMAHLYTDLGLRSSMGDVNVKGTLAEVTDKVRARYDMDVTVRDLQLGKILSNPELGDFTLQARARGVGYDPKTAEAQFGLTVPEAGYHQYNYKNIRMTGEISSGTLNSDLEIRDPNIQTSLSLNGDFSKEYPAVALKGVVDSIDVMALHFASKPLKYHGRIQADFSNTNPDALQGELFVTHNIIATDKQRFLIDTVSVQAESGDTNRLAVSTGFASLQLQGQYKFTQLGDIIQNAINPYFKISDTVANKVEPYHFTLTGQVLNNPALKALLPDLENMQTIKLNSRFDQDSGFNFRLTSPHIHYAAMVVDSLNVVAGARDSLLNIHLGLDKFMSGSSIVVYKTSVDGTLRDNKLNLGIGIADKDAKRKYFLSGRVRQEKNQDYVFSLRPDSLLLNYDKWKIDPDNEVTFGKNGILARDFILSQDDQTLSVQSQTANASSPLELTFNNFQIATLTGFVQSDSLLVNGLLNGNAIIKNLPSSPTFTTDITVNDLSVYQDTLGVLTAKVDNETANQFNAAVTLKGNGNDLSLNGKYFVKPKNSDFDLTLNIKQFSMKSIEGLTNGAVREGRGFVYGQIKANGNMENKNIDGRLQFDNTSFKPAALNSVFRIDKEAIAIINNEGIRFNSFTIRDTTNNALTLGGMINTKDWENFSFDMNIRANDFQAINSTQQDNNLFYGRLVFSTRLNIKGTPTQPVVDGNLSIEDSTSFTVVLPKEDPGIEKREGIVRFVDFSATAEDSIFMAPFDSLKTAPLVGYDVAINIDISKEAEFNLIVDPANGDFLHMRGSAQLSGGIDPSGKINLTGEYLVEDGNYSLSFNFLKRMFLIQKGSKITWTGDPTSAQVDITAVYQTNTAPYELVKSMLPGNSIYYKQKLPFEVLLKMEDELLKPDISFDIVLPDKNYTVGGEVIGTVDQRLEQLRQEPSELNKQVFALLLLNRFVGENPFETGSGGMDASTFAKQSASRLLTEQLNSLTEGLIEGVDLNFDLASTEDYSTGQKQDRTNLKVGVSKRLLNDRLTVTVGNNFELEGPQQSNQSHSGIADDISINYRLSKDGRYMLRAYRTNDYTGALEGYVIETGVSFIITLDYNRLSEIFRSKAEREKKRQIRMHNREADRERADRIRDRQMTGVPESNPEKSLNNEK